MSGTGWYSAPKTRGGIEGLGPLPRTGGPGYGASRPRVDRSQVSHPLPSDLQAKPETVSAEDHRRLARNWLPPEKALDQVRPEKEPSHKTCVFHDRRPKNIPTSPAAPAGAGEKGSLVVPVPGGKVTIASFKQGLSEVLSKIEKAHGGDVKSVELVCPDLFDGIINSLGSSGKIHEVPGPGNKGVAEYPFYLRSEALKIVGEAISELDKNGIVKCISNGFAGDLSKPRTQSIDRRYLDAQQNL